MPNQYFPYSTVSYWSLFFSNWKEERQLRASVPAHIADVFCGFWKMYRNPELRIIRQMLISRTPS